jgi:sugar diacid utilization regulator
MSTEQALHKPSTAGVADIGERLRAPYLDMVDAVAGPNGLERVAAIAALAVGGDVAIVVPRLGPPAVSSPALGAGDLLELRAYVRDQLSGRAARVPDTIVREVPVRFAKRTVGVAALLSVPRRASAAEEIEILHVAAAVVATQVAIEETRDEVESGLRDTLLEELRSSASLSSPEIVRRAARFGCDLRRGGMVVCADGDPDRPRRMMAMVKAVVAGALTQTLDDRFFAVLPAAPGDDVSARTTAVAEEVAKHLGRYGAVGISSFYDDPGDLRRAVAEAELMRDVVRRSPAPGAKLIGTGSYRLLLRLFVTHADDVRDFYENTVGPLVAYDERYGTELLRTLECYLEQNCNMNATAAAMFAHRHTIAYRLERIRELSGLDPALSEHRERLGLGIKAHRILAPSLAREREEGATARGRDGRG